MIFIKRISSEVFFLFNRKSPTVIALGDSWFNLFYINFNFKKRIDTIDWLKKKLNVIDIAIPDYRIEEENRNRLIGSPLKTCLKRNKKGVLILLSLGGNDFMSEIFKKEKLILSFFDKKLVKAEINVFLSRLISYIIFIRTQAAAQNKQVEIMIHGYDYVNPTKDYFGLGGSGSITRAYKQIGINDEQSKEIVNKIIDQYNKILKNFCKSNNIHYVNLLGTLKEEDYMEDIHPTPAGYEKLANKIFDYIEKNIDRDYYA